MDRKVGKYYLKDADKNIKKWFVFFFFAEFKNLCYPDLDIFVFFFIMCFVFLFKLIKHENNKVILELGKFSFIEIRSYIVYLEKERGGIFLLFPLFNFFNTYTTFILLFVHTFKTYVF